MSFFADLPACRRTLGLAGHASNDNMCSKCHLPRHQINSLDVSRVRKRSDQEHKQKALKARDAGSYTARQQIYKSNGIRYSKLCELDYWSLIDNHVIDPMHNLLLGVLAWHCKRIWGMTKVDNVQLAPPPRKGINLITDRLLSPERQPVTPSNHEETARNDQNNLAAKGMDGNFNNARHFLDISFASTEPDNADYLAPGEEFDVPMTQAVFDSDLPAYVNQRLNRIRLPTSISRGIPILGQASYGKLKADEWRNLFTIQLPLCLIPLWNRQDAYQQALLKNFCHLVSMVNIALKRTMTSDQIAQYCLYNRAYLESTLKLFPDLPLTTNHHMSTHIAEGLERYGPVRASWSFPFERFMGQVVKSCHNNRIGVF
ncbi:uncharacterized protein PGTG_05320 [Puccinia graminis f. sp. tritici CRL 75-36-700-3]|uniref:DUF4218 domain-containing protein n=1 Tax=Puccinia graminis f. sp. tritici (strain CRL 75-36-700-3 / race SCCL) TaxID=418459 RepID=E3K719_PUCGT|nr:uncharacterized protein PGTG_05320 [Puccinia graminis f. sp. tritici CRL 75-36-700-3]EFP80095.1 hypothetical protein PGTG_05320 [Puccinia graminis f. sp. tritici CRL 75-36-700-3]